MVIAGKPLEPLDVQDESGRWYSRRICPRWEPTARLTGAIFMLIDIDAERRDVIRRAIVEALHEPLLTLRKNLEVIGANKAFTKRFRFLRRRRSAVTSMTWGGQWNIRTARIAEPDPPGAFHDSRFRSRTQLRTMGRKVMLLNASEVFDPTPRNRPSFWRLKTSPTARRPKSCFANMNAELQHFAFCLDHDLREPLRMVVNFTELLALEYGGKLDAEQTSTSSIRWKAHVE